MTGQTWAMRGPRQWVPRRGMNRAEVRRPPVPVSRAVIDAAVYENGCRQPGAVTCAEAVAVARERAGAFAWVGLYEPDERQMAEVAEAFGLHPLAAEDALNPHQRPKLETYDDLRFLAMRTVSYVADRSAATGGEVVETGALMIFFGPDFVVTVRHGGHGALADVRGRLERESATLALGPAAVVHAITDHVVDGYLSVATEIGEDVDALEEQIFDPRDRIDVDPIYLLKRELVELRHAIMPLGGPLKQLAHDAHLGTPAEVRRYFSDIEDHHGAATELISGFDEMLSSLLDAALAKVTLQQNVDMRRISAWVAIAAMPTMLAGIYGMNFDNMPELHWRLGYPLVIGVMVVVSGSLLVTFRRNKWL